MVHLYIVDVAVDHQFLMTPRTTTGSLDTQCKNQSHELEFNLFGTGIFINISGRCKMKLGAFILRVDVTYLERSGSTVG